MKPRLEIHMQESQLADVGAGGGAAEDSDEGGVAVHGGDQPICIYIHVCKCV